MGPRSDAARYQSRRGAAPSGLPQHHAERLSGHARRRDRQHQHRAGGLRPHPRLHRRRGRRHLAGESREDLQALLHDEARRQRHRTLDRVPHHPVARRRHRREERGRPGHDHGGPAPGAGRRVKLTSRAVSAPLVAAMLTGCATTQLAAPAPTPPPPRSVAVVPAPASAPPADLPQGLAAPPVSVAPPLPAPAPPAATRPTPTTPATPPATATPTPAPAPTAPAPTPVPVPPTAPPPRVLSTAVDDEQRMRRDAQTRIEGTERLIKDIDRTKLVEQQAASNQPIQSFLSKAKEALTARDVQRAYTLADKAYLLASELARGISPR